MRRSLTDKVLLVLALAYTILIGVGSLIHMPQIMEEAPSNSDKIIHATGYFIFCLVWFVYLFFAGQRNKKFATVLAIAVVWSLFFGMIIEISQMEFTTYRTGDFLDMLANTTGVLLAVLLIFITKSKLVEVKSKF